MTHHRLGEKDQAQTTLARLRERWAANAEAEAFLREAAELIEPKKDEPKQ